MFEQSLLDTGKTKTPWTVAVSFAIQALLLGVMVIIPLLNYYELPATELMTFLVAPPPPPPPPPPPAAVVIQKVIPREFDTGKLVQPTEIPDEIAIIKEEDMPPPAATIAGVVGGVPGGTIGGSLGGVIGGIISNQPLVAPPPPPPVKKKKAIPKRIRVGGSVQKARLAKRVSPRYPPLARQARIQGTVKLTAIIARDGSVEKLEVGSGHPLLVPSAIEAVRQWRYKPTLLNGVAVEVVTQIDVIFKLTG